ncbi:MAG TPA: hypothetical protein VFF14_07400 [Candidatus Deferrimicrobium sp.]|nr:hypothetical protein [Candidatus Deferrimicrobium sp.]
MEDSEKKVIKLEQSVQKIFDDISDVKDDVKQVQEELFSWFDHLDESVQDLKLSQAKLEEQAKAKELFENLIRDQLHDLKDVQAKLFLAMAGGGISVIVWLLQDLFSRLS